MPTSSPSPPPKKQGHSLWGGSGAYRWFACPGSIRLCRELPPSPRTPWALEGSCAHHLAATCLREGKRAEEFQGATLTLPPDFPEAEVLYTPDDEMIEHVQGYIDCLLQLRGENGGLRVEQEYDFSWLVPEMWGTADSVIYHPKGLLQVIDLKYGRGHSVDPQDNPQLLIYSVGAYRDLVTRRLPLPKEVHLGIYQPRTAGEALSMEMMPADDLMLWVKHTLRPRVAATLAPDAPLNPGDWCRWCPAYTMCQARQSLREATVPAIAAARARKELPKPELLSKEELGVIVRASEEIDNWISAVKIYAKGLIESGTAIPGCKLVPKRAMRYWISEEDAPEALKGMGISPWQEKLVTPAEAERRAKKAGMKAADLEGLIEKRSNGFNLVSEDDPRPAVSTSSQAELDFKDVVVDAAPKVEAEVDPLEGLL